MSSPIQEQVQKEKRSNIPSISEMKVIPVAGHDSMLLNLSGAHSPFFTRNIVILTDSCGNQGVGEVLLAESIFAARWSCQSRLLSENLSVRIRRYCKRSESNLAIRTGEGEETRRLICAPLCTPSPHWKRLC